MFFKVKKAKQRLQALKEELEKLKKMQHNRETNTSLEDINLELKMIIRRIYPDYSKVTKELLPESYSYTSQSNIYYPGKIEEITRAITIILSEESIFGLKDFSAIKKKTKWRFGLNPKEWSLSKEKEH